MEISETVKRLDGEVKVMRTEIQAILLDIRETYLNRENPFNPEVATPVISSASAEPLVDKSAGLSKKESEDKPEQEEDAEDISGNEEPSMDDGSEEKNETEEENADTREDTASEEACGQEKIPASPDMSSNGRNSNNGCTGKIDLSTIAVMSQWVNEAVRTLGYDKTESILDIAEIIGHMKPELKIILIKFAKRVPVQEKTLPSSTRDYINLLVKLEGLLGMDNKSDELGLLSIFSQEI